MDMRPSKTLLKKPKADPMAKLNLTLTPNELLVLLDSIDTLEAIMMESEETMKDIQCLDKMLKKHGIDRSKFAKDKGSSGKISIENHTDPV